MSFKMMLRDVLWYRYRKRRLFDYRQGQIDKILSGKPEDRRELFDEAAGIVKYKKRKAETVKNLESERQNLVRVNDILAELELQVDPLKKQSEKARTYLDLREELKSKDISMFIMEYDRLNAELEGMKKSRIQRTLSLKKPAMLMH